MKMNNITAREKEILGLVAGGYTNSKIAETLSISGKTVEAHLSNIKEKLGANTRTHAVVLAWKQGIIEL